MEVALLVHRNSPNPSDPKKNPLWRAVSKICGFGVQIHCLRVDGGQIRIKKYAASKIFVWTGPKS